MARRDDASKPRDETPIQAVREPILSSPFEEPGAHWVYRDGVPFEAPGRRPASYWAQVKKLGDAQQELFAEEVRDDLPLVNRLRQDVKRWRESGYRGASSVTKDLLLHWTREDRARPLFFCQREAVETLIYLLELRLPGRSSRTGFRTFEVTDEDLKQLLAGAPPSWAREGYFQTLVDVPAESDLLPLRRLGCKMATGSGKTVVMAMTIAWAFGNRGQNPASREYPSAVLVCCPNLTVRDRLQVLRPDHPQNYYDAFDLVPARHRQSLSAGRVMVTNWHLFAAKSPNREGDATYRVVDKGEETNDAFAIDRLGELARPERLPILVLNDEGHHCWRPRMVDDGTEAAGLDRGESADDREELKREKEEARVWLDGLDRINNCGLVPGGGPGILAAIDLSATPFYLAASGHPPGAPFPWLVNDFGLVDAIESGIVKIPRLPVLDDRGKKDEAGRPDPKYFRLWKHINEAVKPAERGRNKRPSGEAVYREAEGALQTLASQWLERFETIQSATPTQSAVPPVMIVVCDNTEIAAVFFRKISGQREEEVPAPGGKTVRRTIYDASDVLPHFANTAEHPRRTIQIDSRTLDRFDGADGKSRDTAEAELREIVANVGKRGTPGEQVRCVVSVSMLTEGWDASNVTHVLGVRAFGSQLLCEQVVGRGLRRMNYSPDPETGKLIPEYVDVYGIPFSLIPFKARPRDPDPDDDTPPHRVYAVPGRAAFEMRFPNVKTYVYTLRQDGIRCDIEELEGIVVNQEPTKVYVDPVRGYDDEPGAKDHPERTLQNRSRLHEHTDFQTILFGLTREIVDDLVSGARPEGDERARIRLTARHLLFPQVFRIVERYVATKVRFGPGVDRRDLALDKYFHLLVQRVRDGILPAVASDDAPLLPVLNAFSPHYSTAGVNYQTKRPVVPLYRSHLNAAVIHSSWEQRAIEVLEEVPAVDYFVVNDARIGLKIPWEYGAESRRYEPDLVVRVRGGVTVLVEIKGGGGEIWAPDEVLAKNAAAEKWVAAMNAVGKYGRWAFAICRDVGELEEILEAHAGPVDKLPFAFVTPRPGEAFHTCVPLVSQARLALLNEHAQGDLSQVIFADWGSRWARFTSPIAFAPGMFVARAWVEELPSGTLPGAYCLFGSSTIASERGVVRPLLVLGG